MGAGRGLSPTSLAPQGDPSSMTCVPTTWFSGTSSPTSRPDSAAAPTTSLSLVSSWCEQLTGVPGPGKQPEISLTSCPPPSLSSFHPHLFSYPLSFCPVAGHRSLVEEPQLSESQSYSITFHWQRTGDGQFLRGQVPILPSSDPREDLEMPGCLQVSGDVHKPTLSSLLLPLFFQPGSLFSLWNLENVGYFHLLCLSVFGSEVLTLHALPWWFRRFPANAGDLVSVPGSERSPAKASGYPL